VKLERRNNLINLARRGHPWPLVFFVALLLLAGWLFYGGGNQGRETVRAPESPTTAVAPGR